MDNVFLSKDIYNGYQLAEIYKTFEKDSILRFSFEKDIFNKISFLDVQNIILKTKFTNGNYLIDLIIYHIGTKKERSHNKQ